MNPFLSERKYDFLNFCFSVNVPSKDIVLMVIEVLAIVAETSNARLQPIAMDADLEVGVADTVLVFFLRIPPWA